MLAAEFTTNIGLGSLANLVVILTFMGGLVVTLRRLFKKLDIVDQVPKEIEKVVAAIDKVGDRLERSERQSNERWDKHNRDHWLGRRPGGEG
jgi:hypothetical protein